MHRRRLLGQNGRRVHIVHVRRAARQHGAAAHVVVHVHQRQRNAGVEESKLSLQAERGLRPLPHLVVIVEADAHRVDEGSRPHVPEAVYQQVLFRGRHLRVRCPRHIADVDREPDAARAAQELGKDHPLFCAEAVVDGARIPR